MPRPSLPIIVFATLAMIPAETRSAAQLGSIEGKIRVLKDGKPRPDSSNVVVYIEGVPASVAERKAAIRQKNLQFEPRVSVVVKGTTVDFPNEDKVYHNVFSNSRSARFDLGLYRSGSSKAVQFKREGVVDVFCNIHPDMSSRVLVVLGSAGNERSVRRLFDDVGRGLEAARRAGQLAGAAPSPFHWMARAALGHALYLSGRPAEASDGGT